METSLHGFFDNEKELKDRLKRMPLSGQLSLPQSLHQLNPNDNRSASSQALLKEQRGHRQSKDGSDGTPCP